MRSWNRESIIEFLLCCALLCWTPGDTAGLRASPHLEVFGNGSVGEADVEPLDVVPLPHVGPGVVGHRREVRGHVWVRSQSHVVQRVKAQELLMEKKKKGPSTAPPTPEHE